MTKKLVIHAAGKVYQVTVDNLAQQGYIAQAENLETHETTTDSMSYSTEAEAVAQLRQILELSK